MSECYYLSSHTLLIWKHSYWICSLNHMQSEYVYGFKFQVQLPCFWDAICMDIVNLREIRNCIIMPLWCDSWSYLGEDEEEASTLTFLLQLLQWCSFCVLLYVVCVQVDEDCYYCMIVLFKKIIIKHNNNK